MDVGNAVGPFDGNAALELLVQHLDDDNCPHCNNSWLVVVVAVELEAPFGHRPDFEIGCCYYCSIDSVDYSPGSNTLVAVVVVVEVLAVFESVEDEVAHWVNALLVECFWFV